MYEYRCKILRVVDGDTVDVDIDLGFGIWMHKERIFRGKEIRIACKETDAILFACWLYANISDY